MTVDLHAHDVSIVDVVMNRTHGRYAPAFVGRLVDERVQQFDGAPIQDFVRVLVIKEAMDELRRLDAPQTLAS
jgi:hypothetical protein